MFPYGVHIIIRYIIQPQFIPKQQRKEIAAAHRYNIISNEKYSSCNQLIVQFYLFHNAPFTI